MCARKSEVNKNRRSNSSLAATAYKNPVPQWMGYNYKFRRLVLARLDKTKLNKRYLAIPNGSTSDATCDALTWHYLRTNYTCSEKKARENNRKKKAYSPDVQGLDAASLSDLTPHPKPRSKKKKQGWYTPYTSYA